MSNASAPDHIRIGIREKVGGWFIKRIAAMDHSGGYAAGMKRLNHIENGHPLNKCVELEAHHFEKHGKNNADFVFEVTLFRCEDCGLHFIDKGSTFRDWSFMPGGQP